MSYHNIFKIFMWSIYFENVIDIAEGVNAKNS